MQGDCRGLPSAINHGTELMAQCFHTLDQRGWSGEDCAKGRVEILVHGNIDRVEQGGVLLWGDSGEGRGKKDSRAIEMRLDLLLAAIGADLLQVFELHHFTVGPAYWRLN